MELLITDVKKKMEITQTNPRVYSWSFILRCIVLEQFQITAILTSKAQVYYSLTDTNTLLIQILNLTIYNNEL